MRASMAQLLPAETAFGDAHPHPTTVLPRVAVVGGQAALPATRYPWAALRSKPRLSSRLPSTIAPTWRRSTN